MCVCRCVGQDTALALLLLLFFLKVCLVGVNEHLVEWGVVDGLLQG